jgi:hypothetical protein
VVGVGQGMLGVCAVELPLECTGCYRGAGVKTWGSH